MNPVNFDCSAYIDDDCSEDDLDIDDTYDLYESDLYHDYREDMPDTDLFDNGAFE
jgi:hypothetical protein